jgi:hypothetical protein
LHLPLTAVSARAFVSAAAGNGNCAAQLLLDVAGALIAFRFLTHATRNYRRGRVRQIGYILWRERREEEAFNRSCGHQEAGHE